MSRITYASKILILSKSSSKSREVSQRNTKKPRGKRPPRAAKRRRKNALIRNGVRPK